GRRSGFGPAPPPPRHAQQPGAAPGKDPSPAPFTARSFRMNSRQIPWTANHARRGRRALLELEALEDRAVPAVCTVHSLADVLTPAAGVVTLRSALQAANHTPGGNTINLTLPGTYAITLPGTPGETDNAAGEFAILPGGGDLTIRNTSGGAVA